VDTIAQSVIVCHAQERKHVPRIFVLRAVDARNLIDIVIGCKTADLETPLHTLQQQVEAHQQSRENDNVAWFHVFFCHSRQRLNTTLHMNQINVRFK